MVFNLAGDIVELVILTTDVAFLQTLREGVNGSRRLWHVPTADQVGDLLIAGQVGILVLDVAALHEPASGFVSRIRGQFPDLVVVAAGTRQEETPLAGLISTGDIYRFIHKPASPGRAKLFTDAAVKRYEDQRRRLAAAPASASAAPRRRGLWAAATAVALAALLVATWNHAHPGRPDTPPPASRVQSPDGGHIELPASQPGGARGGLKSAAPPRRIADARKSHAGAEEARRTLALRLAAQRIEEDRLIEPDHDNARHYVQEALRIDPDNRAARAAEKALATALLADARAAIARRDFPRAVSLLDSVNGIAPPSDVDNLEQLLRTARRQAQALTDRQR